LDLLFKLAALSLALIHLLNIFNIFVPEWIAALASVITFFSGLNLISKGFKKISIAFLICGASLLLISKQSLNTWLRALESMTNIVAIMVTMQVIAIPFSMGGYNATIRRWIDTKFRSEHSLFFFSTLISYILTSFLMLGSVPFSAVLLNDSVQSRTRYPAQFISSAISRGFVLALLWAPSAVNLYLVIQATGVAWSHLFLPGIILSLIGIGISFWIEKLPHGILASKAPQQEFIKLTEEKKGYSILHVLFASASIILIAFVLEILKIGVGYTRIMISGLIVSISWIFLIYNAKEFKIAVHEYWSDGILKVRDMAPFFIAIGFFSGALEESGLLNQIAPYAQKGAQWLGMSSIIVIPLIIIGISLLGLHPFITIVFLGKIMSLAKIPLPLLTLALSLEIGGAISYAVSPFAGIVMSLARYTGSKASDIALRWNWKFSVLFFLIGIAFSLLWGELFA